MQRGRILVADDDGGVLRAMARLLTKAEYDVETVDDGIGVFEALAKGDFDVLLTDISMPGQSGVEVLREVRARELELPVVLMTGQPSPETAVDAIELGAVGYLEKPVSPEQLFAHLERARKLHDVARLQRRLKEEGQKEEIDRADLNARFDKALASVRIVMQPIIRWSSLTTLGWEVFVRSDEPSMARPRELLGAAERLDRMLELGRHVRSECASAFSEAPSDSLLFVNLHPLELSDPDLFASDSSLAPFADRVVLELTERSCLGRVEDSMSKINALRELGYRVAVDDIADGYASLKTLAALEPDYLKLDRSLVWGIEQSPMKSRLVAAFAALCEDLGTALVAESVETESELKALIEVGCNHFQGHLFAVPEARFPRPRFPRPNEQPAVLEQADGHL